MVSRTISNASAEDLITGHRPEHPEHVEVAAFIAALRGERFEPHTIPIDRLASQAAQAVRESSRGTAKLLRMGHVPQPRRPARRIVAALSAAVLLAGMSGVAVASDATVPGHPLYSIDRALENFGIGDGSIDERLDEAAVLFEDDQVEPAFGLIEESLQVAIDDQDEESIEKIERFLDKAEVKSNPRAAAALEKVAALHAVIAGKTGGDGADTTTNGGVGDDVSDIASDGKDGNGEGNEGTGSTDAEGTTGSTDDTGTNDNPGLGENAGPKDDTGNSPDHAGPKDNAGKKDKEDKEKKTK